jgi:ATP-binding cassette subfamily B protein
VQSVAAAGERVQTFLSVEDQTETTNAPIKAFKPVGKVEFKNVSFSYNPKKPIIKNFSAVIKPKQKVAIVGPTGAGKTTIVNLLMRFYDVNKGGIYIDGNNISNMERIDVRKMFSMVLQDT